MGDQVGAMVCGYGGLDIVVGEMGAVPRLKAAITS